MPRAPARRLPTRRKRRSDVDARLRPSYWLARFSFFSVPSAGRSNVPRWYVSNYFPGRETVHTHAAIRFGAAPCTRRQFSPMCRLRRLRKVRKISSPCRRRRRRADRAPRRRQDGAHNPGIEFGDDHLAVRSLPTLPPIARHPRAQVQVLNHNLLVALVARAGRRLCPHHHGRVNRQLVQLAAASTTRLLALGARSVAAFRSVGDRLPEILVSRYHPSDCLARFRMSMNNTMSIDMNGSN
jgi:hypothetical protein